LQLYCLTAWAVVLLYCLQICGVLYCLENLGPWCAAAAAYLDLLAPPASQEGEEELGGQLGEQEEEDDIIGGVLGFVVRELTARQWG
jgi:hypothetical protein